MFHFTKVTTQLLVGLAMLAPLGCTSQEQKLLNDAEAEIQSGNFRVAIVHLDKVIARNPNSDYGVKAAQTAAKISFYDIQDFEKAARYYQQLVVTSPNFEERLNAQKQIVSVYFDHLTDYPKAVIELNKLIVMLPDQKEKADYKMKLARAYYYQNNFGQAENETNEFLHSQPPSDQVFDMTLLMGNINLAKKDVVNAIEIFKRLLREYPERAAKENVGLTLSVCYEEQKDFKSAIDILTQIRSTHPMPEYIDVRIQRLQGRMQNQPGAKGKFRK